jgi:dTDP-glucose 4,6-dehydratase
MEYKMSKRVLITGGAGFIAHTLVHHILTNTDWEVVTLDRLDYSGNLNRLHDILTEQPKEITKRLKIVYHDLKAEVNAQVRAAVGEVDYILHLAASSHVDRSIEYPMEFVMDNVVGTANILNFARTQKNLSRFIYFSTDEVFGPAPKGVNYAERDRYNSTNPYSATKAGGEELCVAYENTYGLPIYITHTMNVFGERQHPEKYIPSTIKKVRDGELVTIHSDPSKTIAGSRHYIHTRDVAEAILFLLDLSDNGAVFDKDFGGAKCPKFNIVGKEEIDNLELAKLIAQSVGKELNHEMVDFHSARPGHDLRYAMSGNYMKELGWEPKVSLRERIKQVVDWTLNNERWLKI